MEEQALHFEILVEEPSMEAFLESVIPKIVRQRASFATYVYRGKKDLLAKVGARLRGYRKWLPQNYRIVVLVDRDGDDCHVLKQRLEEEAFTSGLISKSDNPDSWSVVNRIVIEELEAWFFGEWSAVQKAYPRIDDVTKKQSFRYCDDIRGGTWEAFERILQRKNYYKEGLLKVESAQNVAQFFEPSKCKSPSFLCLKLAIEQAL